MRIELRMIGTGSAFAKTYFNNSALATCNGYTLMIDCGITVPLGLHKMNVPLNDIDGLFITHLHADHVGGLEELLLRLKFQYNKRPALYIAESLIGPLWEHSLKAGMEWGVEGKQTLEDFVRIVPLSPGAAHEIHPGYRLEIVPTKHFPGMKSFAVILNDAVFYSGDTVFDPDLLNAVHARGCPYLLHDCQLEGEGVVHATLAELMTLPEPIQRKTWLMHYGDAMESYIGKTGAMRFLKQHERYTFDG